MQTGDSMEMFMNIKPLNVKDQPDVAINNLTWRLYDGKNIDYTFAETPFVPKQINSNYQEHILYLWHLQIMQKV